LALRRNVNFPSTYQKKTADKAIMENSRTQMTKKQGHNIPTLSYHFSIGAIQHSSALSKKGKMAKRLRATNLSSTEKKTSYGRTKSTTSTS
jgi:hypothetical protein